jgi:hypothetical protein
MVAKPGKNPSEVTSYRPISLLPLLSKNLGKNNIEKIDTYPSGK